MCKELGKGAQGWARGDPVDAGAAARRESAARAARTGAKGRKGRQLTCSEKEDRVPVEIA